MFAMRLAPCGTNCFLIKKKVNVNDLEGVCLSAFTGCQLPFVCSTAAQCEAPAAVTDLGVLVFVQSCSTPSGRSLMWSYISAKPTRQEETSDDWKSFSGLALLCIAMPFFLSVCCVFAVEGTHGFVCMFDGGRGRWVVSSHNMCYLMCASASLAQAVCIWPFRCMKLCVWFVKVSGNDVSKEVLKKWCVVCK